MHSGSAFQQPKDVVVVRTPDGSATLDSDQLKERYHSRFGAATESRHVYLHHGLDATAIGQLNILEVGLGTGLNALLTWSESRKRQQPVNYTALEPFPLAKELWKVMEHPQAIGEPELEEGYHSLMQAPVGRWVKLDGRFTFRWLPLRVQELEEAGQYDLVYYDAFGPHAQPEMWTLDVFRRLGRAMRPGALLVTYCAKGDVRRTMVEAGLQVERLPGPPGKKEMLRARRSA